MAIERIFLKADSVSIDFNGPILSQKDSAGGTKSAVGGRVIKNKNKSSISAINNVNFELQEGDRLALLGHNGSGKTTLLRLLAGIYMPSSGAVTHSGKMGNALNVNLGFRSEATGRRNIVLKGLVSGVKNSEMDNFIESVAGFAQLGPFLDAPFATYSAGMRARLAFGIATVISSDILLLDEWLGAGDESMRRSAEKRMRNLVDGSSIIVLASHNKGILNQVCNKGLVLNHGQMEMFGSLDDAFYCYNELINKKEN